MAQQQQQMMMYQQAMQQQNMMNAQWTSAHSAPSYTMPSQNPWANLSPGNQPNVSAQYGPHSQQQNQFYGISRNATAALRGYPPIPQSGSATPVITKDSTRNTQSFATMGSCVLHYSTNSVLPQHRNATGNVPTFEVDDVMSNEDAAAILALVEKESERSSSAATSK
ncbi:hypothetical protein AAVH_16757 [Aphelenchoides avenae]|nr:hypothetical protein AAVH_16757 [Aphelenchus avenae]